MNEDDFDTLTFFNELLLLPFVLHLSEESVQPGMSASVFNPNVGEVFPIVIIIILTTVIMIHEDLLARVNDFLSDPLPVVEEAIVGQGVLEHVDLTRPLEYS